MGYSIFLLRTASLGLAFMIAAGTCTQISSQNLARNDIEAIEHQYASYADASVNGDAEAAAATYADQSILIFPNLTSDVGKANILSRHNGWYSVNDYNRFIWKAEWIEGTGSLAVVLGRHASTYLNRATEQQGEFSGYHTQILRRQADGAWKTMVNYIRNNPTNQPVPTDIPDSDRQQIRQVINSYETIPAEYDPLEAAAKFADLYAGQAVIVWPTQRSVVGKENIEVVFRQQSSRFKIVEIKMGTLGLGGIGELAVAYGEKTETHSSVDGNDLETYNGKWAMIFAKIPDEGWKILLVHWLA